MMDYSDRGVSQGSWHKHRKTTPGWCNKHHRLLPQGGLSYGEEKLMISSFVYTTEWWSGRDSGGKGSWYWIYWCFQINSVIALILSPVFPAYSRWFDSSSSFPISSKASLYFSPTSITWIKFIYSEVFNNRQLNWQSEGISKTHNLRIQPKKSENVLPSSDTKTIKTSDQSTKHYIINTNQSKSIIQLNTRNTFLLHI